MCLREHLSGEFGSRNLELHVIDRALLRESSVKQDDVVEYHIEMAAASGDDQ